MPKKKKIPESALEIFREYGKRGGLAAGKSMSKAKRKARAVKASKAAKQARAGKAATKKGRN